MLRLNRSPFIYDSLPMNLLLRPREWLRTIVISRPTCLSVCLSVREDIFGTTCVIQIFVHVAYVRGSVHSGMLTIGRIAYRREGSDGSAQRGRSVIDSLSDL